MRACLAGEDAGAFAVAAAPGPDGAVSVRLRRPDGTVLDCGVAPGPDVAAQRGVPAAAPPPGPGAPAFFLDRRCVDARRVDGPDGSVLGWLAYPGC
jgi:hypothetical protein